jgi:hypothetical protein
MPISTVVKIDLVSSKRFLASQEQIQPEIRTDLLRTLLQISIARFPGGDQPYPDGTFYKADGDAVYFIIRKTSVALRASIEFMQDWYHYITTLPECRVMLDVCTVATVDAPGKHELVGTAFENISAFEKGLEPGKIFLTKEAVNACDHTMAKFVYYRDVNIPDLRTISLHYAEFLDPRTVADSELIHALFIAHPSAVEARDRLFELFTIEYLLQYKELTDLNDIYAWAQAKTYSLPYRDKLTQVLTTSSLISTTVRNGITCYFLPDTSLATISSSQTEFRKSRLECVDHIKEHIIASTSSQLSTQNVDFGLLCDQYLCDVFSEIRMMANYFKDSQHLFEYGAGTLSRYDYVLKRHVPNLDIDHFSEWRRGFLKGLQAAAEEQNLYIASVFHNVLGTYYLNRSTQASAYQEQRLKERTVYLDTNVLYSLLVPASNFHEMISYLVERLAKIGCPIRVFPFTVGEYEESLKAVERGFNCGQPSFAMNKWNPWLLQEYNLRRNAYLKNIGVCRIHFSIIKDAEKVQDDVLEHALSNYGVHLETEYLNIPEDEALVIWEKLRGAMISNEWDMSQYWEFVYRVDLRPEYINIHDGRLIKNIQIKASQYDVDELGPKIVLLTVDYRHVGRLRKACSSVLVLEQFMEYILPYLFLSDIPVTDAEAFPNKLLAAQLGILIMKRPVEMDEMVASFLREPSALQNPENIPNKDAREMAKILNQQRLAQIVDKAQSLPNKEKERLSKDIAELLKESRQIEQDKYYGSEVEQRLMLQERKINKLERRVHYWKEQARGHK